jgi:hypothetical protein
MEGRPPVGRSLRTAELLRQPFRVSRIGSASGPRAENGTFVEGQYVRIGVLDAGDNDKANFSRSEQKFTSCNGENPTLEVLEGTGFVVKEDV